MPITEFKGAYKFLSNFAIAPVVYEGMLFPTVEHAYQAAKTLDWNDREQIRKAYSAGRAKQMGKRVQLREDWKDVRIHIMEILLRQKFNQEPHRTLLLATGNAELIEGNWWNDTFWGVCRGKGKITLESSSCKSDQNYSAWKPNPKGIMRNSHHMSPECLKGYCNLCVEPGCSCIHHQPLTAREKRIRGMLCS